MARRPEPAPAPSRPSTPVALIGAVTAVVVALVAVVVYLGVRGDGLDAQGGAGALPAGGGITITPDAPQDVTEVVVYEDFQCPFCGELERTSGEALVEAAEAGEIALTYVLMSFLDGALGNDSSARAANAAVCASDAGIFTPWHQAAFAAQPEEGVGYTDEQLLGFARGAGLEEAELDAFSTCVQEGTYLDYVEDMQEAANRADVTGTPTVLVDGEPLDPARLQRLLTDPGSLPTVLEAAS